MATIRTMQLRADPIQNTTHRRALVALATGTTLATALVVSLGTTSQPAAAALACKPTKYRTKNSECEQSAPDEYRG